MKRPLLMLLFIGFTSTDLTSDNDDGWSEILSADIFSFGGPNSFEGSDRLTQTINALIDSILTVGMNQIDSEMDVPDLHESAKYKFGWIRVRADFSAKKGHVGDMHSLHRKADSTMEKQNDTYCIETTLGFEKLAVHFDEYSVETNFFSLHGKLSTTVGDNSFLLKVGLKKTSTECKLLLNQFKLVKLGHIKVDMTGRNQFESWLRSHIATWVANHFRQNIKGMLEQRISDLIGKVLKKHEKQICSMFMSTD